MILQKFFNMFFGKEGKELVELSGIKDRDRAYYQKLMISKLEITAIKDILIDGKFIVAAGSTITILSPSRRMCVSAENMFKMGHLKGRFWHKSPCVWKNGF